MSQDGYGVVGSEASKPRKDSPAVHKKGVPHKKGAPAKKGDWHAKSDASKAARAKQASARAAKAKRAPTRPRLQKKKPGKKPLGFTSEQLHAFEQRHRRVVVSKGNETDPYERVYHFDDWVSGITPLTLDLRSPICATEVNDGTQTCTLISQRLCSKKSRLHRRTSSKLGECFAQRESCAVVGSSGHLLDANWGKLIDSHSIVIRVNGAPAGSHDNSSKYSHLSEHVGTRTSVRFVNEYGEVPDVAEPPMCLMLHEPSVPKSCGESCPAHPATCNVTCEGQRGTETICVKKGCNLDHTRCQGINQQRKAEYERHQVFLDNAIGGLADQVVPHSTAGFKAVMYAMSHCDSVSIFGFGPTCHGELGRRYYTEDGIAPATIFHHYPEELGLLLRAEKLGPNAIIPPEARMWIIAKSVTVMLPKCVNRIVASKLPKVLQRIGGNSTEAQLEREEGFNIP